MFQGGGRDHEVGVPARVPAPAGLDPQQGGAVEDRVGHRQDERVLAEHVEAWERPRGVGELVAPADLVPGEGREREKAVLVKVGGGVGRYGRVAPLEQFGERVGVEEGGVHRLRQVAAGRRPHDGGVDFIDPFRRQALVHVAPVGEGISRRGVSGWDGQTDNLNDELLALAELMTDDPFQGGTVARGDIADCAYDGFHAGIVPRLPGRCERSEIGLHSQPADLGELLESASTQPPQLRVRRPAQRPDPVRQMSDMKINVLLLAAIFGSILAAAVFSALLI